MSQFPEGMNETEKRICNKLISKVLAAGWWIKVIEGEEGETMQPFTRDRKLIQKETNATGITIYRLGRPSAEDSTKYHRLGDISLVHGNDEDVVSDCSAPNEEKLKEIEALCPS